MVDISLNLKKTAAIQEIDGSALIRLIDYCDENESWPGCGHEYKQLVGIKAQQIIKIILTIIRKSRN